jgi:hypothetical protein
MSNFRPCFARVGSSRLKPSARSCGRLPLRCAGGFHDTTEQDCPCRPCQASACDQTGARGSQSPMVADGWAVVGPACRKATRIWWSILLTFQKLMIEGRRCARRSPARPISALACWRRDIALAEIRGAPPGSARATCVKGRHPRQPTIVGVAIAFQDSAIELAHPTIERTAWSFCSLSIYRHADGRAPPIPN